MPDNAPVPVFVDDRAGSADLMRYPEMRSAELTRLDFGDVLICGRGPEDACTLVGVEVKSVWDLIGSIDTGRLQATQLPGLIRTHDVSCLLYFGQTRLGRNGELEMYRDRGKARGWNVFKIGTRPVPYGYLEAFLWDVALLGVHVQRVDDERTAAAWLGVLHRWWSKRWTDHKGLKTLDRSRDVSLMPNMDAATMQRVRVAAQLPGVGYDRAVNAAQHFESVRAMVNATSDEWADVRGIGKVIAKAVVEAVK